LKCVQEDFEDTKGGNQNPDRQHNGQKKKDKRTNSDVQNIHIKLKIEQHEPTKTRGGELRCFWKGKQWLLH